MWTGANGTVELYFLESEDFKESIKIGRFNLVRFNKVEKRRSLPKFGVKIKTLDFQSDCTFVEKKKPRSPPIKTNLFLSATWLIRLFSVTCAKRSERRLLNRRVRFLMFLLFCVIMAPVCDKRREFHPQFRDKRNHWLVKTVNKS